MNLIDLAGIVNSETETEAYLQRMGILNSFGECIHCKSNQVLKVRRSHVKCYSCKREWSSKKFSVLEDIRVSPQKFLLVLKCFTLKLPLIVSAQESNLEPKTVRKIYRLIRGSVSPIFDEELIESGRIEFILSYSNDTQQVEMIHKRLTTIDDEHSINRVATMTLKRIRRPNSEYAFQIEKLTFAEQTSKAITGKVAIFVKQIRSQLDKFHGRSQQECLLYLGETIFRFNNNSIAIFKKILDIIAHNVGGR